MSVIEPAYSSAASQPVAFALRAPAPRSQLRPAPRGGTTHARSPRQNPARLGAAADAALADADTAGRAAVAAGAHGRSDDPGRVGRLRRGVARQRGEDHRDPGADRLD